MESWYLTALPRVGIWSNASPPCGSHREVAQVGAARQATALSPLIPLPRGRHGGLGPWLLWAVARPDSIMVCVCVLSCSVYRVAQSVTWSVAASTCGQCTV